MMWSGYGDLWMDGVERKVFHMQIQTNNAINVMHGEPV